MKITILIIILSMCFTNEKEEYKFYETKFEELNLTVPDIILNGMKCINGDCNNGEGRFVFYTEMYEGDFKDNNRHGKGVQVWSNGDYVHGMWDNDEIYFGVYYYGYGNHYGDIYVGEFSNGFKHGEGTYKSVNGFIHTGEWVDDLPNGYGKRLLPDGTIDEGNFINGKLVTKVEL
tara:strand:+ start:126 stop:650 length:525 start_codon:yes stop_codon:yes gene_type:complete